MMDSLKKLWKRSRSLDGAIEKVESSAVMLGPLLVIVSLGALLAKHDIFLTIPVWIAAIGVLCAWRFALKGALYIVGVLLASLLWIHLLSPSMYSVLWMLLWCLSLCVGVVVTALCSQDAQERKLWSIDQQQQHLQQMREDFSLKQKDLEMQLDEYVKQNGVLQRNIDQYEKDTTSFQQLMIACKEEADKYFMQSEHLAEKVVEMQKLLSIAEESAVRERHLEAKNKELLKKLNEARVDGYQQRILAESGAESHDSLHVDELPEYQQQTLERQFIDLDKERQTLRDQYQDLFREYQALVETIYNTERSFDMMTCEAFKEKGQKLQTVRIEILKVEEAVLHIKRQLNIIPKDAQYSPGSYLAIADQECLRLEEENGLLLDLLMQMGSSKEGSLSRS